MRAGYCDHEVSLSVQCDQCSYERDYALGHAAGYAEAVADVVAWLARPRCCRTVEGLVQRIKSGAHVGAAKKGEK